MLPIALQNFEDSIREIFAPKDLDLNLRAFRKGVELARGKAGVLATSKTRKRK
jgi:Pyruvate/2-oxoacid:ferredoxin oxidoreductase gamma subunit